MVGCDGLYKFLDLLQSAKQQLNPSFTINIISTAGSEPVPSASSPDSVSTSVNRINPSVSHVNTLSNSDLSFATWHSRLGHPSGDTMKLVSKLCNIPILNKTGSDFCSNCCIGKSHCLPSSPSLIVYSNHFELIYTDLWGPSPVLSNTGYSYYVTFVDAHTQFTWLYLLKSKSEPKAFTSNLVMTTMRHFLL